MIPLFHYSTIQIVPACHLPACALQWQVGRSRPSAIGFASGVCRAGSGEAGGSEANYCLFFGLFNFYLLFILIQHNLP